MVLGEGGRVEDDQVVAVVGKVVEEFEHILTVGRVPAGSLFSQQGDVLFGEGIARTIL